MNNYDKAKNIKIHRQFLKDFDNRLCRYETHKVMLFWIALFSNHKHNKYKGYDKRIQTN